MRRSLLVPAAATAALVATGLPVSVQPALKKLAVTAAKTKKPGKLLLTFTTEAPGKATANPSSPSARRWPRPPGSARTARSAR